MTIDNINEIILIDDDVINNFYHQMLIKEEIGFNGDITIFTNANEALTYVKKQNSIKQQLFLVDINMPSMNGFEFIEAYQKNYINESAIFCMLTSSLHSKDKELADQFDCIKSFFIKPLEKSHLINFLSTI